MEIWQTSKRKIDLSRPVVMGILNVTPDSFSDGGKFTVVETALQHAEKMIVEGASIIDIGGESTRPGSSRISASEEIARVIPVIRAISERADIAISIDTSKAEVARAAADAGAEIINDISGLRYDPYIADVAVRYGTGLVIMHSRGDFETMHTQPPADDIFTEVIAGLSDSIETAEAAGLDHENIVLDIGIGFGKTAEQNLELTARLDEIVKCFVDHPILYASSRKSFIGKLLDNAPPSERLSGSVATAAIAVYNGAKIIRAHDVAETVQAVAVAAAVRENSV